MEDCYTYNYNNYQLILPSYDIFYELCSSNDKTNLFIYSFLRIIIIISIYEISKIYLEEYEIILEIIYYYIIFNMIYLGLVINKYPKYSKY